MRAARLFRLVWILAVASSGCGTDDTGIEGAAPSDATLVHGGEAAESIGVDPSQQAPAVLAPEPHVPSAIEAPSATAPEQLPGEFPVLQQVIALGCPAITFNRWPLDGTNGQDYYIWNYTDRDPIAGQTRDYTGQTGATARTYDGHAGVDIGIANFRRMDNDDARVVAVAAGTVVSVLDTNFDRELVKDIPSCTKTGNVVVVDHGNGYRARYLHIKQGSARVTPGQPVAAGTVLAVVGSSGCSAYPHLHFELTCNGTVLEPFSPNLWGTSMPAYRPASQVMDTIIARDGTLAWTDFPSPPPDVTVFPPSAVVMIGVTYTGLRDDILHVRLRDPNGTVISNFDWKVTGDTVFRQGDARFTLQSGEAPGQWTVEAQVNSGRVLRKSFRNDRITVRHVAAADLQRTFDSIVSQGYRPAYIDGYNIGRNVFFNETFVLADGTGWYSRANLNAAQFQSELERVPAGFRPVQIETYNANGTVLYAGIFTTEPGQWAAYISRDNAAHLEQFNQLVGQGFRMVNDSPTTINGTTVHAALFDKINVGAWEARYNLTSDAYVTLFNQQRALGRAPAYLNADQSGDQPLFVAIFNSRAAGNWWQAFHQTAAEFDAERAKQQGDGLALRFIPGYNRGGTANFAAFFSQHP